MDPSYLAMSVLLGSSVDEATASFAADAHVTASRAATAQTLSNALRSADRATRARALAIGIEPVLRALKVLEIGRTP